MFSRCREGQRRLMVKSEQASEPAAGAPGGTKAVALRYRAAEAEAPRVVAKGHGALAERILELAFAHGVKVRQDADLVTVLDALDLDAAIPVQAFAAVAEILAHVYLANDELRRTAQAGAPAP